jgi:hypothetical protein
MTGLLQKVESYGYNHGAWHTGIEDGYTQGVMRNQRSISFMVFSHAGLGLEIVYIIGYWCYITTKNYFANLFHDQASDRCIFPVYHIYSPDNLQFLRLEIKRLALCLESPRTHSTSTTCTLEVVSDRKMALCLVTRRVL